VYAGDVEVQFEEEEHDDLEPYENMYDLEPEQANNEGEHENEQENNEHEQENNGHEHEQENHEHVHEDKYKNLSGIYEELLARSVINRQGSLTLPKNATREFANMFHVTLYKVRRLWRRVKECR
jgi:hypothetical protein